MMADVSNFDDRPIGVFDSGVGGMTVLERMLKMDVYNNESGERKSDGRPDFAGVSGLGGRCGSRVAQCR